MSGEVHPSVAPKEMAVSRATTVGKKRARPWTSKASFCWRFWLRGTKARAAAAPNTPSGTLTKKISRHPPAASRRPPTDGPSARPMAWAAPWNPMARPRERAGTTRQMMARLLAWSIAAPRAWRARKPHSAGRSGAKPHRAEARMKMTKP